MIPPGQKVTLRGLAKSIGTSPMPVRDAVTRLVIEGALNMLPSRGLRVYKPTLHEFHEIVQLRCCLEGYATKEAVAVMDQKTVHKIKVSIRQFDRPGHKNEMASEAVSQGHHANHFSS